MDVRAAYDLLSSRPESSREVWPFPSDFTITVEQSGEEHQVNCDGWPIAATAAALFSGGLENAQTPAELDALINQTRTDIDGGRVKLTDLGPAWAAVSQSVYGNVPAKRRGLADFLGKLLCSIVGGHAGDNLRQ